METKSYSLCLTFWLTSLSFHRSWSIWFSYNITALGRWKQRLRKCKKKAESSIWIFYETWCQILYFPWQVNIAFFCSTFYKCVPHVINNAQISLFSLLAFFPRRHNSLIHSDFVWLLLGHYVQITEQMSNFEISVYSHLWRSRRYSYSQTGKTVNTRNISGMLLCCKKKANEVWEN